MMEVLISGEIHDALAQPPAGADYTQEESEAGIYAWYPQIMALCDYKAVNTAKPCDLIENGSAHEGHARSQRMVMAWYL
jgi:hypothetical protein